MKVHTFDSAASIPDVLKEHFEWMKKALVLGARAGARRGEHYFGRLDDVPQDRGIYRGSWRTVLLPKGADLENFAPHAAIIEHGSRPHWAPFAPLLRWAYRKLRVPAGAEARAGGLKGQAVKDEVMKQARGLAMAVRRKIAQKGTKPYKIVGNSLPILAKLLKAETERILRRGPDR